jgi:hypothetical protein
LFIPGLLSPSKNFDNATQNGSHGGKALCKTTIFAIEGGTETKYK